MRSWIWIIIGVVTASLLLFVIGFFLLVMTFGINNEGSAVLAANWREELRLFKTPDVADTDESIDVIRFENGDWLIGKGKNSHGMWNGLGGGTMVIRDSNGEIRSFVGGHICGPNYLTNAFSTEDLDSFYEAVREQEFRCIETIELDGTNPLDTELQVQE